MVKKLAGKKCSNGHSEKTKHSLLVLLSAKRYKKSPDGLYVTNYREISFYGNESVGDHLNKALLYYCASEIRTLIPALVLVIGAEVEIYGITFR